MERLTGRNNGNAAGKVVFITIVAFLIFALNGGVRVNYGLIAAAIEKYTVLQLAEISFAVALAQLMYGFAQPFFGALALKRTNSEVLFLGALMLVAGFVLTPFCTSAWQLDIVFGLLVGCGTGAMAFGLIMSAVTPILGEKTAAGVSGLINGAGGIGGALLSPAAQFLVDRGGLRLLMFCLAALTAVILVSCVWLRGQEKAAVTEKSETEKLNVKDVLRDALKDRDFLHIALAFFTCGFFMAIIETQLYSQMLSLGFSGQTAAFAFTVYGIFGMIGPILAGLLCMRFRCKWIVGTLYALRPVTVVIFLLMPKTLFSIYFFVIMLGLIGNATVPPTTNLLSKLFGSNKLGLLSGTAFVFHQIGSFISTYLGGQIVTATGSYTGIWLAGGTLAAIAGILCYTVREPKLS